MRRDRVEHAGRLRENEHPRPASWVCAGVYVAHVVLTHSDADHASGLREVLRQIPVGNLWLHIPWLFAPEAMALNLFSDGRWTADGIRDAVKKEYDVISEIVDLGFAQRCNIQFPFQGSISGHSASFRQPDISIYIYCPNLTKLQTQTPSGSNTFKCGSASLR
jgi:Metallo-beta-lactamase superfamily